MGRRDVVGDGGGQGDEDDNPDIQSHWYSHRSNKSTPLIVPFIRDPIQLPTRIPLWIRVSLNWFFDSVIYIYPSSSSFFIELRTLVTILCSDYELRLIELGLIGLIMYFYFILVLFNWFVWLLGWNPLFGIRNSPFPPSPSLFWVSLCWSHLLNWFCPHLIWLLTQGNQFAFLLEEGARIQYQHEGMSYIWSASCKFILLFKWQFEVHQIEVPSFISLLSRR